MKKRIVIYFLVVLSIFLVTGCGKTKNNAKEKEELTQKVSFTVESKHKNVTYKLPEGGESGFFKDLGHSCNVSYYTNQSSVAALYPFDDQVDKVDTVTINDFNYSTYKYVDNMSTTYVYRTKVNNDYHLFTYYCVNTNYDGISTENDGFTKDRI